MQVLLLSLCVSLWAPSSQATPIREGNLLARGKTAFTEPEIAEERIITNGSKDNSTSTELPEDLDFEDDYGKLIYSDTFLKSSINSVRNLQHKKGEVLVPCFGMWWPMGGPSYDYVEDDYGDERKKRRRTRKKNKAARMKRKKS